MTEATDTSCPYSVEDSDRLFSLDQTVLRCPFPLYEVLRAEAPVHYNDRLRGWMVTRYEDIEEVVRDTETYSSEAASGSSSVTGLARSIAADPDKPAELRRQAERRIQLSQSRVLLFTDPPLHKRQRVLVSAAFHPRRLTKLEPSIRELADELVGGFVGRPQVDLMQEYALPIPMTVIARLLGVPPEMMKTFKRWSDAFTAGVGALEQSLEKQIAIFQSVDEFYDYFTRELELRRTEPRDDLLTDLVAARMDNEAPLSLDEMLQMLVQFLVAGNETTTTMITTTATRLATDLDLQQRLRADRSLIKPFIEEMLRLESPVQGLFRTTTRETVLAGQTIPERAPVFLVFGSANHDAAAFENPDELLLDGDRGPHLAFSRGEHFCLGANLARLELTVALDVLLTRFAEFRFAGDRAGIPVYPSFVFHGATALPVQLTPAA